MFVLLFTVYCFETPSRKCSGVSAAEKSVKHYLYLCCPFDPALPSSGSLSNDRKGEAKRKWSLYLDCGFTKADAQSCLRLWDCSWYWCIFNARLIFKSVCFPIKFVCSLRCMSQIYTVSLFSFSQTVLITTVHGWATVWARGTTDTSTCSPCPSPCSPFTSSLLTSSTWSCVSIKGNRQVHLRKTHVKLQKCGKTGRMTMWHKLTRSFQCCKC